MFQFCLPSALRPILCLASMLAALALAWSPTEAMADTFTVTNLANDGGGSLRDAVAQANANPGDDSVEFLPALSGTIQLDSSIPVTGSAGLQILGDGRIELDGQAQTRLFTIQLDDATFMRNVTLSGLVLRNGVSNGGGAVFISGFNAKLVLQGTHVLNCAAVNGPEAAGGAVLARFGGGVSVVSSTISGNRASQHGGAIALDKRAFLDLPPGSLLISNSVIEDNSALTGNGGGIYIKSRVSAQRPSEQPLFKTAVIEHSRLSRNSAGLGRMPNGAIDSTAVLSDTGMGSALYVDSKGPTGEYLDSSNFAFDDERISASIGRGGHKVTVSYTTFDGNQSSNGPAIRLVLNIPSSQFPAATITNSTIAGNVFGSTPHTSDPQASIDDPYAHSRPYLGGIVEIRTHGPTEAYDSNDTVGPEQNRVRLQHVTIAGNLVPHSPQLTDTEQHRLSAGLAIGNITPEGDDPWNVDYTIDGPLRVLLYNSILADNNGFTGTDPFDSSAWLPAASYWPANEVRMEAVGSLIASQMTQDLNNNVNFFWTGAFGSDREFLNPVIPVNTIVSDTPGLETLADNGGPPLAGSNSEHFLTLKPFYDDAMPLNSSPAIDAADPVHCLTDDQRQRSRPVDLPGTGADGVLADSCDIGAVETANDRPLIRIFPQSDPLDVFDNGQTSILVGKTLFGPVLQNGPAPTLSFGIRNFNFLGGGAFSVLDVDYLGEVGPPALPLITVTSSPSLPFGVPHNGVVMFELECDSARTPGIYNRTINIISDSVPVPGTTFPAFDYFLFGVQCIIETAVSDILVRNANSQVEVPDGGMTDTPDVNFGPGANVSQPSPPTLSFEVRNLASVTVMDTLDLQPVTTNSSTITVSSQLPSPSNLGPGQSALFALTCDNAVAGTFQATVTILSDTEQDPNESPYTFDVFCTIEPPPPEPTLGMTFGSGTPLPDNGVVPLGSTTPALAIETFVEVANIGDDFSGFSVAGLTSTGDAEITLTALPPLAPIANVYKDPAQNITWNLLLQCSSSTPGDFSRQVEVQFRGLSSSLVTRAFTATCTVGEPPTLTLVPIVDLVQEGGLLTYDVVLSEPLAIDIPLNFVSLGSGSQPASPDDFAAGFPQGPTVLMAGETSLAMANLIDLPTVMDQELEALEQITVRINLTDPATLGQVTVISDEELGFIEDVQITEIPTLGQLSMYFFAFLMAVLSLVRLRLWP